MEGFVATGRRKTSVARVRLQPGSGVIVVNKKPIENYFTTEYYRHLVLQPLELTEQAGNFDVYVTADGGGMSGQVGAVQLGIARALAKFDEQLKEVLRPAGLLTRDPRMVERKKYGRKKARKAFQFSKR